jgi:hypothetical protein
MTIYSVPSGGACPILSFSILRQFLRTNLFLARHRWLMPIMLATQEAEIRRIMVWGQSGQIVCKTLSWKALYKNRAGGVAQSEGPEFKPLYGKKKHKKQWQQQQKTQPFFYIILFFNSKVFFPLTFYFQNHILNTFYIFVTCWK